MDDRLHPSKVPEPTKFPSLTENAGALQEVCGPQIRELLNRHTELLLRLAADVGEVARRQERICGVFQRLQSAFWDGGVRTADDAPAASGEWAADASTQSEGGRTPEAATEKGGSGNVPEASGVAVRAAGEEPGQLVESASCVAERFKNNDIIKAPDLEDVAKATKNCSDSEDDELSEDSSYSDDDEVSDAGNKSVTLGDLRLSLVLQKASPPLDASLRSDKRGPEVSSDALTSDTEQPPYRKQPPSSNAEREKALNSMHNFVFADKLKRQARTASSGASPQSSSREGSSARQTPAPSSSQSRDDLAAAAQPVASGSSAISHRDTRENLPHLSLFPVSKKIQFILWEFVNNNNYQKTFLPSNMGNFIAETMNILLERSAPVRCNVGKLLGHLMKEGILTTEQFLEGFKEIVEVADDLAIDVPDMWLYLAEILVPILSTEALSFSDLKTAATGLHKLVVEILCLLMKEKGPGWIWQRLDEAGMSLKDFASADSVDRVMKENRLEFTVGDTAALSAEAIHAKLLRMLQGAPDTTDEVAEWISQPVTKCGSQHGQVKNGAQKTDVKLRETENPWKPARLCGSQAEQDKTADLYKTVRDVLNKLTPQTFDTLVQQVQALPIDNSEWLHGVIDLVFEKAVNEPLYSEAYAQMCKVLSNMQVVDGSKEGQPENFRKLLLSRCQHEFEKNTQADLKRDDRLKEIEQCTNQEKKKELQLKFKETERQLRMKSVGNMRFVGELFKLGMLTSNIMHRCIQHLLKQRDEVSLECLCKLLTTIGKDLESKKHDLSKYFEEMKALSKQRCLIPSRVRFMLQDVIELRDNKWVPQRDDSAPKTIEQINREAERESMMEMQMPSGGGGGSRGGGGGGGDGGGHDNRGGESVVCLGSSSRGRTSTPASCDSNRVGTPPVEKQQPSPPASPAPSTTPCPASPVPEIPPPVQEKEKEKEKEKGEEESEGEKEEEQKLVAARNEGNAKVSAAALKEKKEDEIIENIPPKPVLPVPKQMYREDTKMDNRLLPRKVPETSRFPSLTENVGGAGESVSNPQIRELLSRHTELLQRLAADVGEVARKQERICGVFQRLHSAFWDGGVRTAAEAPAASGGSCGRCCGVGAGGQALRTAADASPRSDRTGGAEGEGGRTPQVGRLGGGEAATESGGSRKMPEEPGQLVESETCVAERVGTPPVEKQQPPPPASPAPSTTPRPASPAPEIPPPVKGKEKEKGEEESEGEKEKEQKLVAARNEANAKVSAAALKEKKEDEIIEDIPPKSVLL